jgi:hypothetical protein
MAGHRYSISPENLPPIFRFDTKAAFANDSTAENLGSEVKRSEDF